MGGLIVLPAGPLMIGHRLIERMVALFVAEEERINQHSVADTGLLPMRSSSIEFKGIS